jgi:hypothetical protein
LVIVFRDTESENHSLSGDEQEDRASFSPARKYGNRLCDDRIKWIVFTALTRLRERKFSLHKSACVSKSDEFNPAGRINPAELFKNSMVDPCTCLH